MGKHSDPNQRRPIMLNESDDNMSFTFGKEEQIYHNINIYSADMIVIV